MPQFSIAAVTWGLVRKGYCQALRQPHGIRDSQGEAGVSEDTLLLDVVHAAGREALHRRLLGEISPTINVLRM